MSSPEYFKNYAARPENILRRRLLRKLRYWGNREEILAQNKKSEQRCRARIAQYHRERRQRDPGFRVKANLRRRVHNALKGFSKSAGTLDLLGMELPEFRIYLQGQFRPGMTWENYGPVWHVDHVRPCASFDLARPKQQRECFNWSNLQPLFADENIMKGSRCR